MRQIKFRGQHLGDGGWLEGDLMHFSIGSCRCAIVPGDANAEHPMAKILRDYEVDPATVGQFTGLLDKHEKEICKGDILEHTIRPRLYYGTGTNDYEIHKGMICRYEVIYNPLQTSFEMKCIYISETGVKTGSVYKTEISIGDRYSICSHDGYTPKCNIGIIGNIHSNPELLKTE